MKKYPSITLLLLMGASILFAQDEVQKPTIINAVYFDVSPPLRDLVQKSDAIADPSWKEGVVKNKLNISPNSNNNNDFQGPDAVRQSAFGTLTSDTTIQNFEGVSNTGYWPPDTDGEAGLSHYMQVVNCMFAIYDKNGTKLLGPMNSSDIFTGLPNNNNDGDAILLYDENADRWLFSQFSLPNYPNGPFYENVAVSLTSDPTGSWYRYQFSFADMPDYPKLAVWRDGYYMTIRRFASGSGNWLSPSAVAMDRTKMLAGNPAATIVMFNLPSSSEGPQSADCDSEFPPAGTPCPVAYLTSNSVILHNFHVDWTTPANSTFAVGSTISISPFISFNYANYIVQPGTSQKLDPMSTKHIMFRMPYRKFDTHSSMLLNTTVNVGGIAGIRWMELRNVAGTWSLYQESTYAPDANSRWMGSIAMDASGNIALGYSISSSTIYPSIRYTGRLNGDPLGVMTLAEKGIIDGGGSQTTSDGRWGDYSAMSADPAEIGKFWYTQQYYATTSVNSWKTRIGSFTLGNVVPATRTIQDVIVSAGHTNCYNAMQTISVAGGYTSFIVQHAGSATMIAGQNIFFYQGTDVNPGGYLHGYIAPAGPFCINPSMPAVVGGPETLATGLEEGSAATEGSSFKIYPNPTSGVFTLELRSDPKNEPVVVQVLDMMGSVILGREIRSGNLHDFSLGDQPAGIYLIKVLQHNETVIGKIIRQ